MLQPDKGFAYFPEIQSIMWNFHENFTPNHVFKSQWNEWIFVKTPFVYYSNSLLTESGGFLHSLITSMGNPLLWWIFIPAFLGTIVLLFVQRKSKTSQNALFLIITISLMFLPWLFLGRIKFIYYFLMHVPLMILTLCLCINKLLEKGYISKRSILLYCILLVITFAFFYPVLSGIYISPEFVENFLMTYKDWPLL